MDIETMILIISNVIFAFIYIYVLLLFFGIGGSVLSGFNTTVRYKNDKTYKYLLRRYAIITFVNILFTHASVMCFIYKQNIIGGILLAMIIPICIISILILRKNKKFMKAYRQSGGIIHNLDEQSSGKHDDKNAKFE